MPNTVTIIALFGNLSTNKNLYKSMTSVIYPQGETRWPEWPRKSLYFNRLSKVSQRPIGATRCSALYPSYGHKM